MADDLDTSCDVSPDTGDDVGGDTTADYGGDLASDSGTDLNSNDGSISDNEVADEQASDEGVDLGYDYDEAIEAANAQYAAEQELPETSAASRIGMSVADGISSPSDAAQFAAEVRAAPGAEDAYARLLQGGYNMGREGSREFMDATIRQHGGSPSVEYNNMLIQEAMENRPTNDGSEKI